MFDQTFVDEAQNTNKPISLFVSTLIQIGVLGILLLIPLIHTASLPGAMLRTFLLAPRPPAAPLTSNVHKVQPSRFIRVFTSRDIIAPVAVPKQVNPVNDAGAPPDVAGLGVAGPGDDTANSPLLGSSGPGPAAPPPQPEPKVRAATSGPIRVGTGAAEAKLIDKVMPVYPQLAKSARIQGIVEFSATISRDGNIENLQLVRGHPLLVKSARDAVLQWKYRPTLLNGQPVEVLTDILVNFTLTQ